MEIGTAGLFRGLASGSFFPCLTRCGSRDWSLRTLNGGASSSAAKSASSRVVKFGRRSATCLWAATETKAAFALSFFLVMNVPSSCRQVGQGFVEQAEDFIRAIDPVRCFPVISRISPTSSSLSMVFWADFLATPVAGIARHRVL